MQDAEGVEMKYSLQDLVEVEETLVQGEGLWLPLIALQHAGQTAVCGGGARGVAMTSLIKHWHTYSTFQWLSSI